MFLRFCIVTIALTLLCAAQSVHADVDEPGITVYSAAYFKNQQPASAGDMVRLLPGFQIRNGNLGVRGYSGSAGNILIDGQRPISKEESPEAILNRIPAQAVDHIDLIHSGTPGYDMQGYSLLVNVVRSDKASLRGRVVVQEAQSHSGYSAPRIESEIHWQGDGRSVNLAGNLYQALDNELGYGYRNLLNADGTPQQLSRYAYPRLGEGGQVSVEYRQDLPHGSLVLNALANQSFWHADILDQIHFPAPSTEPTKDRNRQRSAEFVAHYERRLSDDQQIRVLASHRGTETLKRNIAISPGSSDRSLGRSGMRETILHTDYRRRIDDISLTAGVEGAINVLNSYNALFSNGQQIALPAANVRVEEQRGEGFVTGTWQITPALTTEVEMRYETSVLNQSGDTNLSKPLSYAKPRLLTTWQPDAENELRFSVEREVGQLNFDDFVSSANLVNNNIQAGNRDLEPDRTIHYELTWEHRFWKRGDLTLTARHDNVTGLIDHVPIFDNGTVLDAIGNIGDGIGNELRADLTMPLDPLYLAGVTVQAEGSLRDSDVIDPATNMARRFSGQTPFSGWVSVTHDLPKMGLRWGMQFNSRTVSRVYKANEFDHNMHPNRLSAFVEYRPHPQWTVRLFGEQLGQNPHYRYRTIYDGLRDASQVAYVEQRSLNTGMMVGINVQHTFVN
jgi:outer membrane receptor protein involved in Fe transport